MRHPTDKNKTRISMSLVRRAALVREANFLTEIMQIGQQTEDGIYLDVSLKEWQTFLIAHSPPGMGDIAAVVARPIARAIDFILPTHLQDCGSCHHRQDNWNRSLPFTATTLPDSGTLK